MTMSHWFVSLLLLLPLTAVAARAADDEATSPPPEIRKLFAMHCGWCHGDFGHKADKGPKLAGTQMTEKQVHDRIRDGKPGYMPSYKQALSED
jgi:mono/diheme cytochrome c family protein